MSLAVTDAYRRSEEPDKPVSIEEWVDQVVKRSDATITFYALSLIAITLFIAPFGLAFYYARKAVTSFVSQT